MIRTFLLSEELIDRLETQINIRKQYILNKMRSLRETVDI